MSLVSSSFSSFVAGLPLVGPASSAAPARAVVLPSGRPSFGRLPAAGPVSPVSSPVSRLRSWAVSSGDPSLVAAVDAGVAASVARAAPSGAAAALSAVPRARWSGPVSVVRVWASGADAVSVACSDGRVRVCRPSFASRALGRPVALAAVVSRLEARVGESVRFCAAFGYSPDQWFVGCVGA